MSPQRPGAQAAFARQALRQLVPEHDQRAGGGAAAPGLAGARFQEREAAQARRRGLSTLCGGCRDFLETAVRTRMLREARRLACLLNLIGNAPLQRAQRRILST